MSLSVLSKTEHYVRQLLESSLDRRLYYHNLNHTVNAVRYASILASAEQLSEKDTEIVLLAEWFHDTGFSVSYAGHEEASVRIATDFLSPLLPAATVEKVGQCILATRKGNVPANTMQAVMHDADYYHFFEPGYFQLVDKLRAEAKEIFGKTFTHTEWFDLNANFLSQQSFYTSVCKARWPQQREMLLAANKQLLEQCGVVGK